MLEDKTVSLTKNKCFNILTPHTGDYAFLVNVRFIYQSANSFISTMAQIHQCIMVVIGAIELHCIIFLSQKV